MSSGLAYRIVDATGPAYWEERNHGGYIKQQRKVHNPYVTTTRGYMRADNHKPLIIQREKIPHAHLAERELCMSPIHARSVDDYAVVMNRGGVIIRQADFSPSSRGGNFGLGYDAVDIFQESAPRKSHYHCSRDEHLGKRMRGGRKYEVAIADTGFGSRGMVESGRYRCDGSGGSYYQRVPAVREEVVERSGRSPRKIRIRIDDERR